MKAVLHHTLSPHLLSRLMSHLQPGLEIVAVDSQDSAGLARELADADVLLHVLAPVTPAMLDGAPRLRLVQKIGVGVNTIDLQAARARQIRVANMPGTNSQAVCEMTLALMLAALRNIVALHAATRSGGGWDLPADFADDAMEVAGKTVGLIGYGEVPRRLAPVLKALGAEVIGHARTPFVDAAATHVPLAELLARSDIVSLHLPLTEQTRHLLNAATLRTMKRGVVIVNTARGGLVDESALVGALRSGQVRAAGLDVFATEPAPAGTALFDLPNVVLAPHVAWLTPETLERSFAVIGENCRRLGAGEPLRFEIPNQ